MRSDRASRWPWAVWFALVGVSAGTVASFALVGWAFVAWTGVGESTEASGVPGWAEETVVIEVPPEAEEPEPTPGVSVEPPRVSEPEAEQVPGPTAEPIPEPVPEPTPEAGGSRPEESSESEEDPRLVPLTPPEDRRECGRSEEAGGQGPDRGPDPGSDDSDRDSSHGPDFEQGNAEPTRPKG